MLENKVVAVVAEFNPFHNGHKYQIDEIKKKNPKIIIALISGDYVQRGEVSLLSKEEKTKIALENGYDIVVELPVYYAIQNSDIFCEFSTKILEYLSVSVQVFGIEEENLENIEKIIDIQKEEKYLKKILEKQKEGNSYIKSHELVLSDYGYKDIYKSNNILALSYIRSIRKNAMNMKYFGIKRKNVDYNEEKSVKGIASASFIRNNITNLFEIKNLIPNSSFEILKDKKYEKNKMENEIFKMFKYLFNVKSKEDIIKVYDLSDSIYNRILKTINQADTYLSFLEKIKGRNISLNRIKRIMLNTLLNIEKKDINIEDEIDYVRILGINEKGAKYLKSLENKNIFVNWKDIEKGMNNKVKIEKNAFILTEILTFKKERLNTFFCKGEN